MIGKCVCVCVCERARESDRERESERVVHLFRSFAFITFQKVPFPVAFFQRWLCATDLESSLVLLNPPNSIHYAVMYMMTRSYIGRVQSCFNALPHNETCSGEQMSHLFL